MQVFSILFKNKNLRIKSLRDNNTSHDKMQAFISGTDASTLNKEGMQMPHFLSLVVCNSGPYVAKLTSQVVSRFTEVRSFGGTSFTKESEPVVRIEHNDVEIEVDEEPVNPLVGMVTSRISVLRASKPERVSDTNTGLYGAEDDGNCLFGQYTEKAPELPLDNSTKTSEDSETIRALAQMVTLSISTEISTYEDLDSFIRLAMDSLWSDFKEDKVFLSDYLTLIVNNYIDANPYWDYDNQVQALIDILSHWKSPHIDRICNELQTWI